MKMTFEGFFLSKIAPAPLWTIMEVYNTEKDVSGFGYTQCVSKSVHSWFDSTDVILLTTGKMEN